MELTGEIKEAIKQYLYEFGNTKESDLITYIIKEFRYSDRQAKNIIADLERKKEIFRVVHSKLKPPAVYLSLKENLPLEIQKKLIDAAMEFKKAELDYYAKIQQSSE